MRLPKSIPKAIAVLLLLPAIACAGWFGWSRNAPAPAVDEGGKLTIVDAGDRELDGSPALALTFSLPLDARADQDKSIQVFEMPLRAGDAPAKRNTRAADDEDDDEFDAAGSGTKNTANVSTKPEDTETTEGKAVPGCVGRRRQPATPLLSRTSSRRRATSCA